MLRHWKSWGITHAIASVWGEAWGPKTLAGFSTETRSSQACQARLWRASTSCGCKSPGRPFLEKSLCAINLEKTHLEPKLTCQMLPQILMALEQSSWMLSLGNTLCMSPSMRVEAVKGSIWGRWFQPDDWHITNPPNPLAFFQKRRLLQNPANNTVFVLLVSICSFYFSIFWIWCFACFWDPGLVQVIRENPEAFMRLLAVASSVGCQWLLCLGPRLLDVACAHYAITWDENILSTNCLIGFMNMCFFHWVTMNTIELAHCFSWNTRCALNVKHVVFFASGRSRWWWRPTRPSVSDVGSCPGRCSWWRSTAWPTGTNDMTWALRQILILIQFEIARMKESSAFLRRKTGIAFWMIRSALKVVRLTPEEQEAVQRQVAEKRWEMRSSQMQIIQPLSPFHHPNWI